MKTRVTELLGIRYPIVQTAMGLISNASLVAAVCNAGGLGILSPYFISPEKTRQEIRKVRELVGGKPFGVNLVPLLPGYKRYLEVIIEEGVPIWNSGLRSPFRLLDIKKPTGVIYLATVGNMRHAAGVEREGADAVLVQGWEGGGHVGTVGSMVLIPRVVEGVKIPVIAAGGFTDGKGLAAALALGAEGIAMGTRFALTQESPVPPQVKAKYLEAEEGDDVLSAVYDGVPLRCLIGQRMKGYRGWWTRPWQALPSFLSEKKAHQAGLRDMKETAGFLRRMLRAPLLQYLCGMAMYRKGLVQGDLQRSIFPSGQGVIRISDIPTCREVVERTVREAQQILKDLQLKLPAS